MSTFTLPDIQRSPPVTVTTDSPVLNIFQPITEASFSDTLRNPVDRIVVANQIVFDRSHLDEPGLTGIIDQRGVTSPAMRVAVLELRSVVQQTTVLQVLENRQVRVFAELSCPSCLLSHLTFFIYQLYKRQIIAAADLRVVLTKRRSSVYHAGTVCQSDIVRASHIVSFFLWRYKIKQRLIFSIFQIFSCVTLQNLHIFAQHFFHQSFCHVVDFSLVILSDLHIAFHRIDTESHVGRQSPWSRGPCQIVGILAHCLKAYNCGALFHVFIPLSNLMAGQWRSTSWTIGNNLISLVEQPFLPDFL